MKTLEKFKNRGVILAIFLGLVPLLLGAFGIAIPVDYESIIYTVSGILVMLGILNDPNEQGFFNDSDGDGVPDFTDKKDDRNDNEPKL
jgi:uncharacterized membrane protein